MGLNFNFIVIAQRASTEATTVGAFLFYPNTCVSKYEYDIHNMLLNINEQLWLQIYIFVIVNKEGEVATVGLPLSLCKY